MPACERACDRTAAVWIDLVAMRAQIGQHLFQLCRLGIRLGLGGQVDKLAPLGDAPSLGVVRQSPDRRQALGKTHFLPTPANTRHQMSKALYGAKWLRKDAIFGVALWDSANANVARRLTKRGAGIARRPNGIDP